MLLFYAEHKGPGNLHHHRSDHHPAFPGRSLSGHAILLQ
jgi:hypothetical protein